MIRVWLAFVFIGFIGIGLAFADKNSTTSSASVEKIPHTTDSLSIEFSANFQSRHVWRGSLTCNAWNIQPTFNVSKRNFLFGAWAAYTVNNSYAEVDLYASYSHGPFTVSILDYFCPNENLRFNRFFDINQSTTQHTIDITVSFDGTKRFPFTLMASTLVWGDDLNPATGKNFFSTYLEAGYSWQRTPAQKFDFLVGFTPFNGYYADKASVVAVGVGINQSIKINDHLKLPIFGKLLVNPYSQNIFFVFGFTLGKEI